MSHTGKTKQPSGVVQWPDADEIMQMAFEEGQPSEDASGYYFELEEFDLFIQRLMEEVARLNQPASAGDERATLSAFTAWGESIGLRPALQTVGELKAFKAGAEWKARAAISAPSHGEQVRHMVPAGWIPVSERLPQIKQVLSEKCTLEGREIPTLYRSGLVLTFDGRHVSAGIVEWFHAKSPLSNVTHWMPLPAPPSAGSQKEQK